MRNRCTVQAFRCGAGALLAALVVAGTRAEETRTVSWFTAHPQERARVELACLDDPGHLARTPDCVNAHKAAIELAIQETHKHAPDYPPSDPRFWSADPEARGRHLMLCKRGLQTDNCDAARRSLEAEAGTSGR